MRKTPVRAHTRSLNLNDPSIDRETRQALLESLSRELMRAASPAQKEVFQDMQSGDEYLFLMQIGTSKEPFTPELIDNHLQITVNTVEGDTTQLPTKLTEYARKKGWLKGFEHPEEFDKPINYHPSDDFTNEQGED
jgi:Fic family protein